MHFLTPDMIGRIATALGFDRNNAQTAIGAGAPGLLAGLSGIALQPGGGQKLVDSARKTTARVAILCLPFFAPSLFGKITQIKYCEP
jgi:hypothetical protein